jgi:uncharacterized phage protein gp47/JayE
MPFTVPSLEEVHAIAVRDYANRFPDADLSRLSDNWKRTRVTAGLVTGLHAHIDSVHADLLPDTARGPALDRWGQLLKVPRKPATPSFGALALRVFGAPGHSVNPGDELVHADGTRYRVASMGVIPPAAVFIDVDLASIDVGPKTRKRRGDTLTFVSAPAGIQSTARLERDLDKGGDDVEDDGAYRPRVLDRIAQPGMGGNSHDYLVWQLQFPGVASAYVWPLRQGLGSVDVASLHAGRGTERILAAGEAADLQAYLDAVRPVAYRDLRVLTVVPFPVDIEIGIAPEDDPKYAFDWRDDALPTVAGWDAATRVLTFAPPRPADLLAGDRLAIRSAAPPYGDGSELVVEALGPGADDVTITGATAPTVPPAVGDTIHSGGPLVAPIREAILGHLDSLGPARGAHARGSWEGTVRTSILYKIAQTTPGVQDSVVIAPTENVEADNTPPSPFVGLVVPRLVVVRRVWP